MNEWLAVNKPAKNVFLQGWPVVANVLSLARLKGVLAVGENDGGKLALVVEQMAAMDVRERYRVVLPCHLVLAIEFKKENKQLSPHTTMISHRRKYAHMYTTLQETIDETVAINKYIIHVML